mmetsp:Transcript_65196/g.169422  ORF Transcript_65196/g.169422 Transcript_65196/m.169422 type:complete len:250 (+) Transcript_65196:532-1281(+)
MRNQCGLIDAGAVLDRHQLRLRHHGVRPVRVEANALADACAERPEVPDQVLGAAEHVQKVGAVAFKAAEGGEAQVELPALTIRTRIPRVAAGLSSANEDPLAADVHAKHQGEHRRVHGDHKCAWYKQGRRHAVSMPIILEVQLRQHQARHDRQFGYDARPTNGCCAPSDVAPLRQDCVRGLATASKRSGIAALLGFAGGCASFLQLHAIVATIANISPWLVRFPLLCEGTRAKHGPRLHSRARQHYTTI